MTKEQKQFKALIKADLRIVEEYWEAECCSQMRMALRIFRYVAFLKNLYKTRINKHVRKELTSNM